MTDHYGYPSNIIEICSNFGIMCGKFASMMFEGHVSVFCSCSRWLTITSILATQLWSVPTLRVGVASSLQQCSLAFSTYWSAFWWDRWSPRRKSRRLKSFTRHILVRMSLMRKAGITSLRCVLVKQITINVGRKCWLALAMLLFFLLFFSFFFWTRSVEFNSSFCVWHLLVVYVLCHFEKNGRDRKSDSKHIQNSLRTLLTTNKAPMISLAPWYWFPVFDIRRTLYALTIMCM